MKIISGVQAALGLLITYFAWYLADTKAGTSSNSSSGDVIFSATPPSAGLELTILLLGILVFALGLIQCYKQIRLNKYQIIFGFLLAGISAFLMDRATALKSGEISDIYYIAYLSLVLGLSTFLVGLIQFKATIVNQRV